MTAIPFPIRATPSPYQNDSQHGSIGADGSGRSSQSKAFPRAKLLPPPSTRPPPVARHLPHATARLPRGTPEGCGPQTPTGCRAAARGAHAHLRLVHVRPWPRSAPAAHRRGLRGLRCTSAWCRPPAVQPVQLTPPTPTPLNRPHSPPACAPPTAPTAPPCARGAPWIPAPAISALLTAVSIQTVTP